MRQPVKSAQLVVTSAGTATSLGGVVQAMAAARAGLTRPDLLGAPKVMDEDEGALVPITGHPVSFLTRGFVGMARLARLGALALEDLLSCSVLRPTDLTETALLVALGSGYYDDCAAFIEEQPEDAPPQLGARRVKRCIVGGIDSYCDPEVLPVLHSLEVLKTPENPVGFMPGEAAAFLIVETRSVATKMGRNKEWLAISEAGKAANGANVDTHHPSSIASAFENLTPQGAAQCHTQY